MSILIVVAVLAVVTFFLTLFTVDQQTVALIERFGKYSRASHAGLNIKIPYVERISGLLSLRVQQLDVVVETKTKDNVFINVTISVQYHVIKERIYDAYYQLTNPRQQIESFVFDVIRAQVPKMNLDDVFENKDSIALAVQGELSEMMSNFGYGIVKALVTNLDPDVKVKNAMNEINEQQRLRMAAQEKGEAEKILRVKKAEAESESMRLQGMGVANQRKAIIEGLKTSIQEFQQGVPGVSANDVLSLVMMTQYFDTLKEIGSGDKTNTILLPHSPAGLSGIIDQLRNGIIAANQV